MKRGRKVELLSPAGNAEGFYGAIHAGADAVYLAGEKFGARAYAENFTTETLVECIRYAHLLGRKVYLTVNTLLKEREIAGLESFLRPFYEAGLDAVIVQDLGVVRLIREHFPELKIHASTQMTVCGSYGVNLLKDMGVSRIIPARELSLEELAALKRGHRPAQEKQPMGEEIPRADGHSLGEGIPGDMEIETFVHGAMCYCYSGQCLFSSILGGRSGNRGRCAQPCRLPYRVNTGSGWGKECYPLSLKDMCTIEHIPELVEAGIDSFKIEGRMKKPEYTAGVTAIYRRYIDKYEKLRKQVGAKAAAEAYQVEKADLDLLQSLYIRSGSQDGYYFRHNGREMITLDSPAYSKNDEERLAEISEKYLSGRLKLPVHVKAVFQVGHPAQVCYLWEDKCGIATGDVVERAGKHPITRDNIAKQLGKLGDSAFRAAEMEIQEEDCFYPLKGMNDLRREAILALENQILEAYTAAREKPDSSSPVSSGEGQSLDAPVSSGEGQCPDSCASVRQVQREALSVYRREDRAVSSLDPGGLTRESFTDTGKPSDIPRMGHIGYAVSARTLPQLEAIVKWFSGEKIGYPLRIYIEGDLFLQERSKVLELCSDLPSGSRLFLALPYILREGEGNYLERLSRIMEESGIFKGFLARSLDGLGFVRQLRSRLSVSCRTDAGVYIWNRQALKELPSFVEGICLPWELNGGEQRDLTEKSAWEKIVYGRIPMMITANCLLGTFRQCGKDRVIHDINTTSESGPGGSRRNKTVSQKAKPDCVLKDRLGSRFPVAVNCLHCMNIIYNSVPFSLHHMLPKWKGRGDLRIDFTIETSAEVKAVLDAFLRGAPFPFREYTTGHEKRGVE